MPLQIEKFRHISGQAHRLGKWIILILKSLWLLLALAQGSRRGSSQSVSGGYADIQNYVTTGEQMQHLLNSPLE